MLTLTDLRIEDLDDFDIESFVAKRQILIDHAIAAQDVVQLKALSQLDKINQSFLASEKSRVAKEISKLINIKKYTEV